MADKSHHRFRALQLVVLLLAFVSIDSHAALSAKKYSCAWQMTNIVSCSISGTSSSITCRSYKLFSYAGYCLNGYETEGDVVSTATSSAPAVLTHVYFPVTWPLQSPDRVCANDSASNPYCWKLTWLSDGSNLNLIPADTDNDGTPDWSDTDDDNDGVADVADNCPINSNIDQLNTDGDSQGNVCDTDDDNDGSSDGSDGFPLNPAASSDSDNDGYPDSWRPTCDLTCQAVSGLTLDNCPTISNPTQANNDGDAQGDACDADDDNDGWADTNETTCGTNSMSNLSVPVDTDGDLSCNTVDADDDNDGHADTLDLYPLNANKWQSEVRHDIDRDRDSDVVIRSASTGAWTSYGIQNNAIVSNAVTNAPTSSDSVYVAQLDANGDGDADILTRSASTGAWSLSIVESGAVTSTIPLYLYANLDQQFVGGGDFNNDGIDDVMLRSTSAGYYTVFLLSNHAVSSSVFYNAWTAASSVDQGIGDFNGDGTDDLLVRRTSDNLYFIFKTINGEVNNYYCACNIWANPDWTFRFAGDTNKDGIDDIVIRGTGASADGKWWAFQMNNFSSALTTNLNMFLNKTAVTVGSVGDYNGDGTVDVLTRVNNSTTYVSPIVNGTVSGNYWLYNFTTDQVIGK